MPWTRRIVIGVEPGQPPPVRYGDLVIHGARYVGRSPWGDDLWECYGWKPYDATLYRLREQDPRNCPHEVVPLGWECWATDLRWLARGDGSSR
ncbi:MAG: hypothetical protein ACPL5F_12150 [Moorellaceae bacterium]